MKPELKEAYKHVRTFYNECYAEVQNACRTLSNERDLDELADFAYALREMANVINDLRADLQGKRAVIEQAICMIVAQQDRLDPIITEYCRATPKPGIGVSVPSPNKDFEKYAELMEGFGIHERYWKEREKPVLKVDWNGLIEYCSDRLAQGHNLPPFLKGLKQHPIYSVRLVARKEVDAEPHMVNDEIPF